MNTEDQGKIARRSFLLVGLLGPLNFPGCVSIETNPRDGNDTSSNTDDTSVTESPFGDIDEECTNAYITNFEWQDVLDREDKFSGTLINNGNIAGEVLIQVEFFLSEDMKERTGSVQRDVPIGAQATKEVTLHANPPTDDSNWAAMKVVEQDCRFVVED